MNIILFGVKNCGKSSTAPLLSKHLSWSCLDTDSLIETAHAEQFGEHRRFNEIYHLLGESRFRMIEHQVIKNLQGNSNQIIAVGGSSLLNSDNVTCLRSLGILVHLQISFEVFLQRLNKQTRWPYFIDIENVYDSALSYYTQRRTYYDGLADHIIAVDHLSYEQTTDEIIDLLQIYPMINVP